jgi:phosphomannomutase
VLAGNGFKVYLTDSATPTPVIAFAVVDRHACGAVNITASHNPSTDNGFKVRNSTGGAIDPEGLLKIEALIPDALKDVKRKPYQDAELAGEIVKFDAHTPYIQHINKLIDLQPIIDAGLTIMVDVMWGNGAGYFPRLLAGGSTRVLEIHNQRNPSFPEMIHPNLSRPISMLV